jgi:catechol 2,3-dioxygenase-like lactoylglutathione lyase family enzyme
VLGGAGCSGRDYLRFARTGDADGLVGCCNVGMLRFDHVGVIVDDIDAVSKFFLSLGFEREFRAPVEGEVVDRINGLDGIRNEVEMLRTPDRSGRLELIKYYAPADTEDPQPFPPNRLGLRHIAIEVEDLNGIVHRLQGDGFDPVGEVQDYGNSYRLVYVRGPEGLIVELAENIAPLESR